MGFSSCCCCSCCCCCCCWCCCCCCCCRCGVVAVVCRQLLFHDLPRASFHVGFSRPCIAVDDFSWSRPGCAGRSPAPQQQQLSHVRRSFRRRLSPDERGLDLLPKMEKVSF